MNQASFSLVSKHWAFLVRKIIRNFKILWSRIVYSKPKTRVDFDPSFTHSENVHQNTTEKDILTEWTHQS